MSDAELFQVDDVVLECSRESTIRFENGQMQVQILAAGAPHRKRQDLFILEYGYDQPCIRLTDITFPTPEGRVVHSFRGPDSRFRPGLWLDGFAEAPTFEGEVRTQDGWLVIEGELRRDYGALPGPRILVRKRFEPGEIDPGKFTHVDLGPALEIDAQFVQRLEIGGDRGPVPPEVFRLTHLRHLHLGGYGVEDSLNEFARLQRLEGLQLSGMQMRSIPEGVFRLAALTSLSIRESNVEEISESIVNLGRLESLTVTNTPLRSVPEALFRLPNLQYLDLQWNKLVSLPDVSAAKQLREFHLKGNAFTSLPPSLASLTKVSIEAKFKPLYMDSGYKKAQPIDAGLFSAEQEPGFVRALDEALRANDLTRYREPLLQLSRKGVQFTTTERDDYSKTGNTRFGGDPDLPRSIPYPVDEPFAWIFLAQLDLNEIAPHQSYLPRTGTLSFFAADLEHVEEVRVIHHAPGTTLRRCPPPPEAVFDQGPFDGFRAEAAPAFSLPCLYNEESRLTSGQAALLEIQQDDALSDRYRRVRDAVASAEHGINLHVFTQHESPEEQAAEDSGGQHDEWMVLLRLGYDRNPGFCFWDAGTLSFMIHKRDLANQDFSRVVAFIESS